MTRLEMEFMGIAEMAKELGSLGVPSVERASRAFKIVQQNPGFSVREAYYHVLMQERAKHAANALVDRLTDELTTNVHWACQRNTL